MLRPITTTPRGFQIVEFCDIYGEDCIWLGPAGHRIRLDRLMVRELVRLLANWEKTGRFDQESE